MWSGIEKIRDYLIRNKFTVLTDINSLKYLSKQNLQISKLNTDQGRTPTLILQFQLYNFLGFHMRQGFHLGYYMYVRPFIKKPTNKFVNNILCLEILGMEYTEYEMCSINTCLNLLS